MAINVSVRYNGRSLLDIILLTHLNAMNRFYF